MPGSLHNLNQHLRLLMLKEGGFNGKAANYYDENEYAEKMEEFYGKLDLVKQMVKPGSSVEQLNMALTSLASLIDFLGLVSPERKLLSSL